MLSRVAGRVLTGPLAFFLAGVLDVGLLLLAYARWRVARRAKAATAEKIS